MKKYDQFQDGFTKGLFVMTNDLREIIDYIDTNNLSKEEIVEELKKSINDSLLIHIVAHNVGLTEESYDLWVNNSKLIRTDVKYKIIGNLMEYGD